MIDARTSIRSCARALAKRGILEASCLLSALGFFPDLRGRGAIFTLHHVRPKTSSGFAPNAHLEITPEFLDLVIRTLADAGYDFIRLEDIADRMSSPSKRPFAVFTLDDGYRDNATHALPVFARHNVPFTVFICSGFTRRTHTMWWETLLQVVQTGDSLDFDFGRGRERIPLKTDGEKERAYKHLSDDIMRSDERLAIEQLDAVARSFGLDPGKAVEETILDEAELKALSRHPLVGIGAHTVSHRAMARLSDLELHEEIHESGAYLAALLGSQPVAFAYPYGHYAQAGAREARSVAALGFRIAVTTREASLQESDMQHMTLLPRINLSGLQQKKRYIGALASGIPFRKTRYDR